MRFTHKSASSPSWIASCRAPTRCKHWTDRQRNYESQRCLRDWATCEFEFPASSSPSDRASPSASSIRSCPHMSDSLRHWWSRSTLQSLPGWWSRRAVREIELVKGNKTVEGVHENSPFQRTLVACMWCSTSHRKASRGSLRLHLFFETSFSAISFLFFVWIYWLVFSSKLKV